MTADCDCILLAAGASSRATQHKLLAVLEGVPLVGHSIRAALSAVRRVILVLGHEADAIRTAAFASVPRNEHARILPIHNPHHRAGMFSSIQEGMRHATSDWVFVTPADLPDLTVAEYRAVAAPVAEPAGNPSSSRIDAVVPHYRGTRGHPVLLSSSLIPVALARSRDGGPMRELLASKAVANVHLDTRSIIADLDTDSALADRRSYGSSSIPAQSVSRYRSRT